MNLDRWYPLKDIPEQLRLIREQKRFKVIPAGRRSGKTERFKRYLVKYAMSNEGMYFAGAPTINQAKKIFWKDLLDLAIPAFRSKAPNKSELIIYLANGSEIHIIGFDRPERFEGIPWDGGGIDESGNIKDDAWENNIFPALDTENPTKTSEAWLWIFGVPEGLNKYYDLYEYAKTSNDPEWGHYHWKSSEVLSPEKIEAAKRRMSARQFRQEYEASFETAQGKIYEDYSEKNYTDETIKDHEQLLWHHDFNYTPMSSGIAVKRGSDIYILDEIILTSAVSSQSALEFVDKFKGHKNKNVIIYGDPAGRSGEKHGHTSDYTEIERVLRDNGWRYERRVKSKAPAIKDRQNAVRAKIMNACGEVSLYVNPNKAKYAHKGLATCQLKQGSSFQEEENDYQHITTAIGYMIDYEFPIRDKMQTIQTIGL